MKRKTCAEKMSRLSVRIFQIFWHLKYPQLSSFFVEMYPPWPPGYFPPKWRWNLNKLYFAFPSTCRRLLFKVKWNNILLFFSASSNFCHFPHLAQTSKSFKKRFRKYNFLETILYNFPLRRDLSKVRFQMVRLKYGQLEMLHSSSWINLPFSD